jgi:hypothetical protein
MTRGEAAEWVNFETLRHAIEHCDPDVMLGFYAEDAQLSIVNASVPQAPPFVLRGKAEVTKHLRATFGHGTTHRVEREVVGEDRVTFREACEYPDGGRVLVETMLEVCDGKIVRQVEVVSKATRADREGETGQRLPTRKPHPGENVAPSDRLSSSKQATEKEDLG